MNQSINTHRTPSGFYDVNLYGTSLGLAKKADDVIATAFEKAIFSFSQKSTYGCGLRKFRGKSVSEIVVLRSFILTNVAILASLYKAPLQLLEFTVTSFDGIELKFRVKLNLGEAINVSNV